MQVIILFISFLFLQNMQGYVFENKLLLLKEEGLSIYDLSKKDDLLIIPLSSAEKWNIGTVTKVEEVINILLHDDERYIIGSNFNKSVNEKEFAIGTKDFKVLFSKERTIVQRDNGLFLEKEGERLDEKYLYERYLNNIRCLSEEGNLYLIQEEEIVPFLSATTEGKVLCGYYQPDMSNDGKKIICEYQCSKYNGKKQISEKQIVEIHVKTKKVNKIQLFGYSPTYSEDGRVILYKNVDGYNLYFKETKKVLHLEGVSQAIWIR